MINNNDCQIISREIYIEFICSKLISESKLIIGCELGILLIVEFENNQYTVRCYNESDYRITDLCYFIKNNNEYCVAAHKDASLYIWDITNHKYLGKMKTIPGTDIYNCDFTGSLFDTDEVKELIEMNGGII